VGAPRALRLLQILVASCPLPRRRHGWSSGPARSQTGRATHAWCTTSGHGSEASCGITFVNRVVDDAGRTISSFTTTTERIVCADVDGDGLPPDLYFSSHNSAPTSSG